jgi:hypothetical protein
MGTTESVVTQIIGTASKSTLGKVIDRFDEMCILHPTQVLTDSFLPGSP